MSTPATVSGLAARLFAKRTIRTYNFLFVIVASLFANYLTSTTAWSASSVLYLMGLLTCSWGLCGVYSKLDDIWQDSLRYSGANPLQAYEDKLPGNCPSLWGSLTLAAVGVALSVTMLFIQLLARTGQQP